MSKSTTHKDFIKAHDKLCRTAGRSSPPFRQIRIRHWDGGLLIDTVDGDMSVEYTPKEAVRVAKWILAYYGEEPEEVY